MRSGKKEIQGDLTVALDTTMTGDLIQRDVTRNNDNIMLNAFRIAINGSLAQFNMVDGIVDEYEDESSVDTASSTNEDYDSANDYYSPSPLAIITQSQTSQNNEFGLTATAYDAFFQQFQVSTTDNITKFVMSMKKDAGATGTLTGYIYSDSGDLPNSVLATFSAVAMSTVSTSFTNIEFTGSFTPVASTKYHMVVIWTGGTSGDVWRPAINSVGDYANGRAGYRYNSNFGYAGATTTDADFDLYQESSIDNMTLISDSFTAEAQPDSARIVILEEDVDSVTLNTDLIAKVSRDGGTSWSTATLVDEGNYDSSKQILAATVDISSQAAGTSMEYKIETANNKDLKIHGVGLSWD